MGLHADEGRHGSDHSDLGPSHHGHSLRSRSGAPAESSSQSNHHGVRPLPAISSVTDELAHRPATHAYAKHGLLRVADHTGLTFPKVIPPVPEGPFFGRPTFLPGSGDETPSKQQSSRSGAHRSQRASSGSPGVIEQPSPRASPNNSKIYRPGTSRVVKPHQVQGTSRAQTRSSVRVEGLVEGIAGALTPETQTQKQTRALSNQHRPQHAGTSQTTSSDDLQVCAETYRDLDLQLHPGQRDGSCPLCKKVYLVFDCSSLSSIVA